MRPGSITRCCLNQRPRGDVRRLPRRDLDHAFRATWVNACRTTWDHRFPHDLGQRPRDLGQRLPCGLGQRLPPFATGEASPTIGDAFTAGAGLSQRVRGGSSPPLTVQLMLNAAPRQQASRPDKAWARRALTDQYATRFVARRSRSALQVRCKTLAGHSSPSASARNARWPTPNRC